MGNTLNSCCLKKEGEGVLTYLLKRKINDVTHPFVVVKKSRLDQSERVEKKEKI